MLVSLKCVCVHVCVCVCSLMIWPFRVSPVFSPFISCKAPGMLGNPVPDKCFWKMDGGSMIAFPWPSCHLHAHRTSFPSRMNKASYLSVTAMQTPKECSDTITEQQFADKITCPSPEMSCQRQGNKILTAIPRMTTFILHLGELVKSRWSRS